MTNPSNFRFDDLNDDLNNDSQMTHNRDRGLHWSDLSKAAHEAETLAQLNTLVKYQTQKMLKKLIQQLVKQSITALEHDSSHAVSYSSTQSVVKRRKQPYFLQITAEGTPAAVTDFLYHLQTDRRIPMQEWSRSSPGATDGSIMRIYTRNAP